MRRQRLSPAEHKIRCIERIAAAELTEEHGFILGRCVDAYLALRGEDLRQFEELRSLEHHQEVAEMEMTWLQRAEAEGLERGRQEGRREGRQEGRQEGEVRLLLGLLERQFGPLTKAVRARVAAADAEVLLQWSERVLTASRLDEVFED